MGDYYDRPNQEVVQVPDAEPKPAEPEPEPGDDEVPEA